MAFDVGVIGGHLTMESDSVDHGESESVEKLPPITGSSKVTSVSRLKSLIILVIFEVC